VAFAHPLGAQTEHGTALDFGGGLMVEREALAPSHSPLRRRWRALACVCVLVLALAALLPRVDAQLGDSPAPDLVLVGGRIFTADSSRPWAEALAIHGERIVAVGTTRAILALAGPATRRVELGGRVVVPGFNDAHNHFGWGALPGVYFQTSDDPVPDPPLALLLDSLAAHVRRTPAGTWLRTDIDIALLDDPHARRVVLDSVAPRHPVWLAANTGHGVIVNTSALRALGIRDSASDPVGGFYEREGAPYPGRGHGRMTGLLHEYAAWNAAQTLRLTQPDSVLAAAVRRTAERALRSGVTSIQSMANAMDPVTTCRVFDQAQLQLRVRVVSMPTTDSIGRRAEMWRDAARDPACARSDTAHFRSTARVDGMKWILDGTGVERLSLLRAPYGDRPAWSGQVNFPVDTLRAILSESLVAGEQPILHAVGDSTIALVLATMESLAPGSAWRRLRPRLEHAEWLTPDLRERARRLGIVVAQNPTHFTDGLDLMKVRYGDMRSPYYQPFRSLAESGIALAIGSDGVLDPFLNLQFAITHPDNPHEALTREGAVTAYTRGSAYAEHAEHEKGVLAPGMLADLAVLSRDIFTVEVDALPGTESLLTLVGGRVVYDAGVLRVEVGVALAREPEDNGKKPARR
jgi:predicted amidohydrolase YtcJ